LDFCKCWIYTFVILQTVKNLTVIGASTVSGGIPEDIQKGIVQVVTALIAWLVTKLLDRLGKK